MKHFNSLSVLIIALFSSIQLSAADYYIDAINGNDGNNGSSPSNAFRSLYKIDQLSLQPGDTVYFMEGTYQRPGSTLLTVNESGTEGNPITFKNYQDDVPVLEFNGWTGIDIIGGSSYLVFDGLHVKGARTQVNLEAALAQGAGCEANFEGGANGFYNGTGILAVGPNLRWSNGSTNSVPHHITVTNCEIYDCTSSGMAFQQADYVTITNNKVYNNCWYTIYGTSGINMYQFVNVDGTTGFHNTVTNNLMYGNRLDVPQVPFCSFLDGNGLIIDDFQHVQTFNYRDQSIEYDSYNAKTLVANNVAVENGGSGLHFYLSANCYILNNTIVNNASQNEGANGNAELRIGRSTNFVVKNNLIKGDYTIHAVDGNGTIDYSHNYQLGPDISAGFANCEGCIEDVEINFENTSINSDRPYITSFESLVKDAGVNVAEVTSDYLNFLRPNGEGYDIGAYELYEEEPCELLTWYADTDADGLGDAEDTILACEQPEGYVAESGDLCTADPNKTDPGECGCGETEESCVECELLTWYLDADNDGVGNANESIENCEQPDGYVATSGDLCDNDANKTEPGNCGCGVAENSCGNPDDVCDSPEYSRSAIYANAGTTVIYDGYVYENKWYTQGQLPTSGGPWEMIAICDSEGADCSSIASWSASTVYAASRTQVTYQGSVYENKWYTQNNEPGFANVWQLIDICSSDTISNTATSFSVEVYDLNGALQTSSISDTASYSINKATALKNGIYIVNFTNLSTGEVTMVKQSK